MDRSSTRDSRPPNEVMAERSGLSTVGRQSSSGSPFSCGRRGRERDQINEMAVVSAMGKNEEERERYDERYDELDQHRGTIVLGDGDCICC